MAKNGSTGGALSAPDRDRLSAFLPKWSCPKCLSFENFGTRLACRQCGQPATSSVVNKFNDARKLLCPARQARAAQPQKREPAKSAKPAAKGKPQKKEVPAREDEEKPENAQSPLEKDIEILQHAFTSLRKELGPDHPICKARQEELEAKRAASRKSWDAPRTATRFRRIQAYLEAKRDRHVSKKAE